MKTYDYIITFRQRNLAIIDRISEFMLLITIAGLAYRLALPGSVFDSSSLLATSETTSHVFILVTIALIIGAAFLARRKAKKQGKTVYYRYALGIAAIAAWYIFPKGYLTGIVYMLAALLEGQVKFPREVAFDDHEIVVNSFPRKRYKWSDMGNIVLKDNMLTLDFKNNKLIQQETQSDVSKELENEFNIFCSKRLK